MANVTLPGNSRYQPKDLIPIFGYDNLARAFVEVEIAALKTLGDVGVVKQSDLNLLTPEVEETLLSITTTQMDKREREVTKHDIRALVQLMQEIVPAPLRRWVHVPLTSYDVIDTARSLQFVRAHKEVVQPKTAQVIQALRGQALQYAGNVQIGRTHAQHALPITVGFWFATVLDRVIQNLANADKYAREFVGKISGAVGAYNAQVGLGINTWGKDSFENRVLDRLGLIAASISTQILPPEPLAYYLFSCTALSGSLGQFGRDGRNLMRTEIAELAEPFEQDQVGSSTMPHKRNPIHFENLEGQWKKNKHEFSKVLETMISEHQRDLVGSSVARDFPIIIVNLVTQLDTLLRPGKSDPRPFLSRIVVDLEACRRNLGMQGDRVLAEPWYLMLQMAGYEGDAHELINHRAVPMVGHEAASLHDAVLRLASENPLLKGVLENIPKEQRDLLSSSESYVGEAQRKVLQTCNWAHTFLQLDH